MKPQFIRSYVCLLHFLIDKFDYMDTFLYASPSWYEWNRRIARAYGPMRCDVLRGHYIPMICHCVDKFVPLDYRFSNWNIDFPFIGHPLRWANQSFNEHTGKHRGHMKTKQWEYMIRCMYKLKWYRIATRVLVCANKYCWANRYNLISERANILILSIK